MLKNGGAMMKKTMIFPIVALTVGLTACSTTSHSNSVKKVAKAAAQTDLKRPLVKFFMNLSKKINEKDAALNTYEASDKPTPDMLTPASDSASDVSVQLTQIQIPSQLKSQKIQLEAALKDLAESYSAKAEELKKEKPSLDEANATFLKGVDELGKVYEDNKLLKPDLGKEVN
jgi:hypothetical protein